MSKIPWEPLALELAVTVMVVWHKSMNARVATSAPTEASLREDIMLGWLLVWLVGWLAVSVVGWLLVWLVGC